MKKQIYKKDGFLIIKVPLKAERSNPYDEDFHEEMDNITGLIIGHHKDRNRWDECGFAYLIDRDYKGKCDDISSLFFISDYDVKEFVKLCKDLKINVAYFND